MQEQQRRPTLRTHAQAEIIVDDDVEEMEKPIAVEEMKEEMKETKEETVDVSQCRRLLARALDDVHLSPSPPR